MRRKQGQLVPFEVRVLEALDGQELHGVAIGKALGMSRAYGYATLYKALRRLEGFGHLTSRWEDDQPEGRPRRRLYRRARQAPAQGATTEGME